MWYCAKHFTLTYKVGVIYHAYFAGEETAAQRVKQAV